MAGQNLENPRVLGGFSKKIDPLASTALSPLVVMFALSAVEGHRLKG
jgi:hypothetical protein